MSPLSSPILSLLLLLTFLSTTTQALFSHNFMFKALDSLEPHERTEAAALVGKHVRNKIFEEKLWKVSEGVERGGVVLLYVFGVCVVCCVMYHWN